MFSDDLSLAPTEIYRSPSSTPRALSLVSAPSLEQKVARIAQEQKTSQDVWCLPEFGDSPVSSPPRTPSPEGTPPSTPSVVSHFCFICRDSHKLIVICDLFFKPHPKSTTFFYRLETWDSLLAMP